ncbi:Mu transposase domain-containing protein [Cumulibacter manganitolerans]|uniref:Mu transposase domain-containing protein n=1 Tax=Cumulibacter manganitolerans TaxID=1884992 RepID=UPI00389947E7
MIGRFVDVRADLSRVEVRHEGRLVAAHDRIGARRQTITDPAQCMRPKSCVSSSRCPGRPPSRTTSWCATRTSSPGCAATGSSSSTRSATCPSSKTPRTAPVLECRIDLVFERRRHAAQRGWPACASLADRSGEARHRFTLSRESPNRPAPLMTVRASMAALRSHRPASDRPGPLACGALQPGGLRR